MFNPMNMLRELRDDPLLTTTELTVLMVAVLRTKNATGRVRVSQEILAKDAKVSRRTVVRVFQGEAVQRYFQMERVGWQLNLTWKASCDTVSTSCDTVSISCDTESHLLPLTTSLLPLSNKRTTTDDYESLVVDGVTESHNATESHGFGDEPRRSDYSDPEDYLRDRDAWSDQLLARKVAAIHG